MYLVLSARHMLLDRSFPFFVDAIKNVFIQKENDCESYDHPFVKELLDYIDVALTYIHT